MDNKGFTKIENTLYMPLLTYGFTATELIVVMYIIRKTTGYQQIENEVCISEMARNLNKARQTISRIVQDLIKKNVIAVEYSKPGKPSTMRIKAPAEWDIPATWELHATRGFHPTCNTGVAPTCNIDASPTATQALQEPATQELHYIKKDKDTSKEKNKESPSGTSFSQDEDDDWEDPDDMIRRPYNGNL